MMKRRFWFLLTAVAVLLILAAAWFISERLIIWPKKEAQKGLAEPCFIEVPAEEFFEAVSCSKKAEGCSSLLEPDEAAISALRAGLSWLKKRPPHELYPFAGKKISASELASSLEKLLQTLTLGTPERIRQGLEANFRFFRLKPPGGRTERAELPMLVTGYYQPRTTGQLKKGGPYVYPLYGVPSDLVSVRLKDFDQGLPDKTLFGRIQGQRLIPYFSRFEIDAGGLLPDSLALCWLKSYVDALEIQIQGSAVIELGEGQQRFIHYAASNGRPYGSLGRWLIEKGYLPAGGLDWPSIRAWAEANPGLLKEAMKSNPRYIFFRWEDDGPIGALGFKIIPGRSAACDPAHYAPASPLIVRLKLPDTGSQGRPSWARKDVRQQERATLLLFNHDKGAAIKGPFRLDLYCGTGKAAGALAGRLKAGAEPYLILSKEVELAN